MERKIASLISGEAEFIAIIPNTANFQNLLQKPANSNEEYEEQVDKEKELFQEIQSFLQRNDINVYETVLIE